MTDEEIQKAFLSAPPPWECPAYLEMFPGTTKESYEAMLAAITSPEVEAEFKKLNELFK